MSADNPTANETRIAELKQQAVLHRRSIARLDGELVDARSVVEEAQQAVEAVRLRRRQVSDALLEIKIEYAALLKAQSPPTIDVEPLLAEAAPKPSWWKRLIRRS
jgi:hypothetical protein